MPIPRALVAAMLAALSPSLLAQETAVPAEAAARPQAAAGVTVGVVDLAQAFEQYPRYQELKKQLEAMSSEFNEQMKALRKREDELRGTVQMLDADSDEKKQREFELEMAMQQQRWFAKHLRDRLDLEEARASLAIYEDLEAAVAKVAKARGVAIVLRTYDMGPSPGDPMKLPPKTVLGRLTAYERRQVWFATPEVDLTGDLIKLLMVPLPPKQPARAGGEAPSSAPPARSGNGERQ